MAGRYATALFELANDQNAIDQVRADLDRFDRLVEENPELARLLRSPVFGADEQSRAITAILQAVGISGLTANFIRFVAQNRRLFAVRDMARGFRNMVARHRGEVNA
jgi:F-type H+-transporting ATPase subunit delta